jgi:hypothetical protein
VTAAAAGAAKTMPADYRVSITNAPGAASYPISSFTWLLIPKQFADPAKGVAMKDFLNGCWTTVRARRRAWATLRCRPGAGDGEEDDCDHQIDLCLPRGLHAAGRAELLKHSALYRLLRAIFSIASYNHSNLGPE